MNAETWNSLTFFEQLSNIDGDVERLIRAHEKYINSESDRDNGIFYLENIKKLIKMTLLDPKNIPYGYRAIELYDEVEELNRYINGECSADYIRSYWNQYTNACSAM